MPSATYSAGTAYLTVVPSFLKITDAFKKQVREMAKEAENDLATQVAKGLAEANRKAKETGRAGGRDYAGAYETEAKRALTKAWQTLPEPQPDVNLRKWDKALAGVRADMKQLGEQRIGIDIDRATFDRALDDFKRRLEELRNTASGQNKEIGFFNADQAAKELAEFQKFSDQVSRRAGVAGEQAGSAFNQRMAKALSDGISKIPPMKIDADSTDAERKIAELRQRMVELSDKRIGVDIEAGEAYAKLKAIAAELDRLDRKDVRVDVRTNAHEAAAGMQALVTQTEAAGASTQNIGGRADFSRSRLELLIALGGQFGTIVVPAAAAAAGAIGTIGTAAVAALSGVGVFALSLDGVGDAVKALGQYQNDQAKSANSIDQANRRVAGSTDQVRMAQMSLANTRRQVAEAAEDAARRVSDAERGVSQARRQAAQDAKEAARDIADARKGVAEAERDVGDARRQAAIDIAEANRQVKDAQRGVTDAEEKALDVRKALTQAIDDAKQSMLELGVQIKRNEQDQSEAVTAQMKALEELNKLRTNPRATEIELRQAEDAYNEQTVRIEELQVKHKELADQKKKYDKEGVEGDEQVIAARKRIADADEAVADARAKLAREEEQRRNTEYNAQKRITDAQQRVAKAQEQLARTQERANEQSVKDQERIRDAERAVSDARRAQSRQALDAQFQLAQASNAVTAAQRSQQQAWEKTGTAGGDALDTLNEKMANLSPAQQNFAKFLFGLKDEYLELKAAAAEPLLPQLETAITMLTAYLPGVERFIGNIAEKLGSIAIRAVDALGNPVWQRFFNYIDRSAVPTLEMMYQTTENVAEGLISLFLALTPFNEDVGEGLVKLSRDFAEWAERLDKTEGYRAFLEYVQENGPRVVHFLGELGQLFIEIVRASAPLGEFTLKALTLVVDVLNSIPQPALTALVLGIGAVATGMNLIASIMRVVKFKQQFTDIFGPRSAAMIQTYAIETGRATEQTGKLGKATATAAGLADAARNRVTGYVAAVGTLPSKLAAATTGSTVLGRTMDTVRASALQAAAAVNGPGGVAGAVQTAQSRIVGLAAGAEVAARTGLGRLRSVMLDIATSASGPGGLAAGAQTAAGKVGNLAKAGGNAATAIGGKLVSGLSTASALLGGPWGVALTGATIAIGTLASASADYNGKIETLKNTLNDLGTEYKDLAEAGKIGTNDATKILADIVTRNPEMRNAIVNLDSIGISIDKLGRAAAGSKADLQTVLTALDQEIDETEKKWKDQSNFLLTVWSSDARATSDRLEQLRQLREAVKESATEQELAQKVQQKTQVQDERAIALTALKNTGMVTSIDQQQRLLGVYDKNATSIQVLNGLYTAFNNAQSTAAERANAVRAAIAAETDAVVDQSDAEEQLAQKTINLRDQVNQAKAAHDKNSTSLSLNSQTALRNRDALEDVATSIRNMYVQDVAAGKPLADVTKAHNNRIAALKEEAKRLGLDEKATADLIKKYGDVPETVKTTVTMDPNSFQSVYKNLQRMQFMQSMLRLGKTPSQAENEWNDYQRELNRAIGRAEGGPIVGPGTGTSDDVLMWGSNGEYVHKTAAVRYYGDAAMAALNNMEIPRENLIPRRAQGGPVNNERIPAYAKGGKVNNVQYKVDVSHTWVPDAAWVRANTPMPDGGGGIASLDPDATTRKLQQFALQQRGKRYLWAAVGPDRYDCSGLVGNLWALATGKKLYRRYMSTSDMGPGRHGMVSGPGKHMTIYLGPGHTAANVGGLHVEAYGGNGTPLAIGRIGTRLSYYNQKLHIPGFAEGGMVDPNNLRTKGDRMVSFLRYGWPEPPRNVAMDDLLQSQLVASQFDTGGMLPPGYSTVVNNTGSPEPVLTSQQWRDISELARSAARPGGNTYQFAFRDTTLDPAELRRIQDREAVLARADRAR